MSIRKSIPAALFMLLTLQTLLAQNTNSTYSRYGYGNLETPAMGKARAMGGIGYGYHDRGLINVQNPASFADVDTMNMLFDFGMSAQLTAFKEGTVRQYNPNAYMDHVGMKFALKPKWGVALGLVPFSKVGYHFSTAGSTPFGEVEYINTYTGTGGLNTFFLGTGAYLAKGLSVGANLKYTFGVLSNMTATNYITSGINNEMNLEYMFIKAPSLDLGVQYDLPLSKKSYLTLGASASVSMPVSGEVYTINIASDTLDNSENPDRFKDFELPTTIGAGVSYNWDNRLTVGLDFQKQQFSKSTFMGVQDSLRDNNRIALGIEYLPSTIAEHYYQAIRYRGGFQFNDMYLKQPGHLQSAGLSLGVGLPLRGQKSMLNLSFEAGRLFTPNASFISETYYKFSIDVSFNELWFFKLKL